jgi:hypothetical protein
MRRTEARAGGEAAESGGGSSVDVAAGEGVHQWNNLWFCCYPKYTQMWCCAIN